MVDSSFVKNVLEIVEGASHLLLSRYKTLVVKEKSPGEYVTSCDMSVESALIRGLSKISPTAGFYSEEAEEIKGEGSHFWVVDPVDGTHNLMFNNPLVGISVSYFEEGKPKISVVCLPFLKMVVHAVFGEGCFVNNEKVMVSNRKTLDKSVLAFDNTYKDRKNAGKIFEIVSQKVFTSRISGAASVDMAMTFSGKLDGRIFCHTKFVDFAHAVLLAEESGGKCTDFNGELVGLESKQVVISNGHLHSELLNLIQSV